MRSNHVDKIIRDGILHTQREYVLVIKHWSGTHTGLLSLIGGRTGAAHKHWFTNHRITRRHDVFTTVCTKKNYASLVHHDSRRTPPSGSRYHQRSGNYSVHKVNTSIVASNRWWYWFLLRCVSHTRI